MTYGVILIIISSYMSSRSYGENFVSIQQVVAEKNRTHVLCGQTNKQTNEKSLRMTLGETEQSAYRHQAEQFKFCIPLIGWI